VTTSALRDLQKNTEEAQAKAAGEAVDGNGIKPDPNQELVAELQSLRRQLSDLQRAQAQGQGAGQNGRQTVEQQQLPQPGQAQGQEQSQQPGQGQQAGNQPGQQQGGGQQGQQQANAGGQPGGVAQGGGQFGGRNYGFGPGGPGWYDPRRGGIWDPRSAAWWQQNPQAVDQARQQLNDASRDLVTLGSRLRDRGLSEEELKAVRELGEALRRGLTGNPELIDQEFQSLVNQTEQLELKLGDGNEQRERAAVRAEAPAQIAEGYEESVAEYFRRLSRSAAPTSP
jgi:hypothetical protein